MASDPEFTIFTSIRFDELLAAAEISREAGWNTDASSPLYMLDLHRDRLLRAAIRFDWRNVVEMLMGDDGIRLLTTHVMLEALRGNFHKQGPCRVMISVTKDGTLTSQWQGTPVVTIPDLFPKRMPAPSETVSEIEASNSNQDGLLVPTMESPWLVVVDSAETETGQYTHFKTSIRHMYNMARERMGIKKGQTMEVLIRTRDPGAGDQAIVVEGSIATPYFWRSGRWVTPPVVLQNSELGGQDGTTRRWALARNIAQEEIVPVDSLVDGEKCWLSNGVRGFFSGTIKLAK